MAIYKMNKLKFAAAASVFSILMFSCATTKSFVAEEDKTPLLNTENTTKSDEDKKTNLEASPAIKNPTPFELYKAKTEGITLKVTSYPAETTKGKAFSKPYEISVADKDGKPAGNIEIAVKTPFSSERTVVTTDETGKASYLPPVPEKSFYSEIKFFPDGDMGNAEIAEEAEKISAAAPYKVQTNMKSAGGVIAVVDFSKSEKPITSNPVSSSNLLMSLMKLGFTRIGNIDLTNDVLKDDSFALQKKTRAMVGNSAAFLVYGTVKYKSVEKSPDGTTTVALTGKIKALDLKTGGILFDEEKDSSASGKNEWNALRDARVNLSAEFASALKYGI